MLHNVAPCFRLSAVVMLAMTLTTATPMSPAEPYFEIDPSPDAAARLRKERDNARALKRTPWWKRQLHHGVCHYCGGTFRPDQLSMDHVVPLARGGTSTRGNVVPACTGCNHRKKLETPADTALRKLAEDGRTS